MAKCCEELTQLKPGQSHLSTEKSVAKVNDRLCQKLEPQEVNSLVQTPRTNVQAAGEGPRIHHQRFEALRNEIQIK